MSIPRRRVNRLLKRTRQELRAGDKAVARELLDQIIGLDEQNETAWFYRAWASEDEGELRECLERVLAINPRNTRAQRLLDRMTIRDLREQLAQLSGERTTDAGPAGPGVEEQGDLRAGKMLLDGHNLDPEVQREGMERPLSGLQQLESEIAEKEKLVEEARQQLRSLEGQMEKVQTSLALRQEAATLREGIQRQEATLTEMEAAQSELGRVVAEREIRVQELQDRLGILSGEIGRREDTVARLGREAEMLQDEIRDRQSVRASIEATRLEQEGLVTEGGLRLDDLRARQELLEAEIRQRRQILATLAEGADLEEQPATLAAWETRFRSWVPKVGLLGEIPVTAEQCTRLGELIGSSLSGLDRTPTLRFLRAEYPLAFCRLPAPFLLAAPRGLSEFLRERPAIPDHILLDRVCVPMAPDALSR